MSFASFAWLLLWNWLTDSLLSLSPHSLCLLDLLPHLSRASPPPPVSRLIYRYANLLKVEALLKQLKLAALDFLKSLDILNRSSTTLCDGIQKFSSADDQYKLGKAVSPYRLAMNEAVSKGLAHTCRGKIEHSLHRKVLKPIEQNLRLFQDIKERIVS